MWPQLPTNLVIILHIYTSRDYGETWTLITKGIKDNYYTRVVRSDKKRKACFMQDAEWGMYISFDDGNSWSEFQLNLPIASIRDLHVKENDLVVATHGRSFWVIDDLTPLHQINEENQNNSAILYKPDLSYRMAQSGGWSRLQYASKWRESSEWSYYKLLHRKSEKR